MSVRMHATRLERQTAIEGRSRFLMVLAVSLAILIGLAAVLTAAAGESPKVPDGGHGGARPHVLYLGPGPVAEGIPEGAALFV
jgi:hypothetical protein